MKNTLKEILKITVLGSALVVVQAFAFSEPGTSAPGGSAVAPINVGNVMQTKDGALRAQMLRSFSDAFFATDVGNVGIGTMSPATKLHVVGGKAQADDFCINSISGDKYALGCLQSNGKVSYGLDGFDRVVFGSSRPYKRAGIPSPNCGW